MSPVLIHFEESKLNDLFSLQYNFDPLKSTLKLLFDKLNQQSTQLLNFKDISEKVGRIASLDKLVDQRLVFLE